MYIFDTHHRQTSTNNSVEHPPRLNIMLQEDEPPSLALKHTLEKWKLFWVIIYPNFNNLQGQLIIGPGGYNQSFGIFFQRFLIAWLVEILYVQWRRSTVMLRAEMRE